MADRTASAVWKGGLFDGQGRVKLDSSGIGEYEVSWPRRAEAPEGKTSPEELLAAAHASCYCMQLSLELTEAGGSDPELNVSTTVTLVPGTGITTVALKVRGRAGDLDEAGFLAAAEAAKEKCPVSGLFQGGSAEITLDAALAGA